MTERDSLKIHKHLDPVSLLVILLTFVLFLGALVVEGLGHDLLLEAGVFLVSVKLIIMAYKSSIASKAMMQELTAIRSSVARLEVELAAARGSKDQR